MAHGIIPPFSNHLICEDFLAKAPVGIPIEEDIVLLGEASNEVLVTQEVAEGFQSLLAQAYSLYLADGLERLCPIEGMPPREERAVLAVLLGIALDVDDAREIFSKLLPGLRGGRKVEWASLVSGALRLRIQAVEDEIGLLIKEGAKDAYTHASDNGGMESLERLLCAA